MCLCITVGDGHWPFGWSRVLLSLTNHYLRLVLWRSGWGADCQEPSLLGPRKDIRTTSVPTLTAQMLLHAALDPLQVPVPGVCPSRYAEELSLTGRLRA